MFLEWIVKEFLCHFNKFIFSFRWYFLGEENYAGLLLKSQEDLIQSDQIELT